MKAELERLMQVWSNAWLEHDASTVERLMAPEYVYIAPNGQVLDRPKIMGIIRSPSYSVTWGLRTEVSVLPLGADSAVVSSRWQGEGTYQGRPFKDDHRCTSVFVQRGGEWQMSLEHCSGMTETANGQASLDGQLHPLVPRSG